MIIALIVIGAIIAVAIIAALIHFWPKPKPTIWDELRQRHEVRMAEAVRTGKPVVVAVQEPRRTYTAPSAPARPLPRVTSTPSPTVSRPSYDPDDDLMSPTNPLNPLNPLSPISIFNQEEPHRTTVHSAPEPAPVSHTPVHHDPAPSYSHSSHTSSYDSGSSHTSSSSFDTSSSWSSHDSTSSSSFDTSSSGHGGGGSHW